MGSRLSQCRIVLATMQIGSTMGSVPTSWLTLAMTIVLVTTWFFIFTFHARALLTKKIMGPSQDDVVDDAELTRQF